MICFPCFRKRKHKPTKQANKLFKAYSPSEKLQCKSDIWKILHQLYLQITYAYFIKINYFLLLSEAERWWIYGETRWIPLCFMYHQTCQLYSDCWTILLIFIMKEWGERAKLVSYVSAWVCSVGCQKCHLLKSLLSSMHIDTWKYNWHITNRTHTLINFHIVSNSLYVLVLLCWISPSLLIFC